MTNDKKTPPSSRVEQIYQEYQAMAAGYDEGSARCGWSAPETLVQALERLELIKPGMEVVDFAAGTGALSEALRHTPVGKTLHITSADLSPAMLEQCRAKNVSDELIEQDITENWKVEKASKDIVAATGVGEYLTDDQLAKAIKQAADTLKQGGKLAFTFLPAAEGEETSQQVHDVSYVQKLFEENGISMQMVQKFDAYKADNGQTIKHVLAVGWKR